ncbi:magnesium transporter [Ectothiorhodospira lacustris]|uniref:magnesium transporter n=1 Tax=Ectothiorhodospira lacustris TaxID=2899127 RepID=UPI001EE9AEE0|nr:magnesium transporter [Ectothiorhodospira lacustris]MCG5510293.1 magnesium transporter [Ectothiorhodospira lacustris]MCG5521840.1 magnesium transporter [Ectothiorhodospira lacustris]
MSETATPERPGLADLPALLAEQDWEAVQAVLADPAEPDIAHALPELPRSDRVRLMRLMPPERASAVYAYLDTGLQTELLEDLSDEEKTRLIGELSYDDAAAILDELPDAHTDSLMEMLPEADQQVLKALLAFPEHSAGRLMTPEFVALSPDWTVRQALDHVREQAHVGETLNTLFITGEGGRLLGWISLQDLLLSRPRTQVAQHYHRDLISIHTQEDREEAARLIGRYDLQALPVVDADGTLAGIITVDDVMDVVQKEDTEDFHKMGSVGVLNLSVKDATAGMLYRKRIGWLVILVAVNIVSGAAIAFFETAIEKVVALVFFLPMVIASGGNAGAQASTLMVRALATGDVQARDWFRLWGKELLVALSLGITLGLAVWLIGLWLGGTEVAIAIAISMVLVVITGSMFGMVLPFILARFKLDPATASAPLVTSVVDVAGIVMYFAVATLVLQMAGM